MKSGYKGLWWLLAIALLVIVIISFCEEISLGSFKIKQSPIADILTKKHLSEEEIAKQDSIKKLKILEKQKPLENPVDTTPQIFLIFGDSMTENVALRLAAYAKQNGHEIHTVNWDSSGTRIWSQTDTLQHYIDLYKPTYFFIVLGSNESYAKNIDNFRPYVKTLLAKLGDKPYVWIGPPKLKEEHGFNDMLAEETGRGAFFRADGLELARRKDKIHPTREAAAYMVDSVVRWLAHSAHPIKMDVPSDSLSKTKIKDTGMTYLKPLH